MKYKVHGIGEILWDLLPSGKQLGGAPAIFACHAQALGAEARLISRGGNDPPGRDIFDRRAYELAAFVSSQPGATPVYPNEKL